MVLNASDKCHPLITFTHKAGCSKFIAETSGWSHDPIEEVRVLYASEYQLFMLQQVVAIIIGLFLVFKGRHRANEIIGLAFGYATFIMLLAYFMNNTDLGMFSYLIAGIAGLVIGYIAFNHLSDFFIAALGALAGAIIALILISIFNI